MRTRGGDCDCFVVCLAVDGCAIWFCSSVDTQLLKMACYTCLQNSHTSGGIHLRVDDVQFIENVFDDSEQSVVVLCGQQFLQYIEQN